MDNQCVFLDICQLFCLGNWGWSGPGSCVCYCHQNPAPNSSWTTPTLTTLNTNLPPKYPYIPCHLTCPSMVSQSQEFGYHKNPIQLGQPSVKCGYRHKPANKSAFSSPHHIVRVWPVTALGWSGKPRGVKLSSMYRAEWKRYVVLPVFYLIFYTSSPLPYKLLGISTGSCT